MIRHMMNTAKKWEWISEVPDFKTYPETPIRIRWITKDEAQRLINELPRHLPWLQGRLMNIALIAASITDPVFVPHRIRKKPLSA